MGGVARRCWAGNSNAIDTAIQWNKLNHPHGSITIPSKSDEKLIMSAIKDKK